MIVLTIRTDKPLAQARLLQDSKIVAQHTWQAHRQLVESLHAQIAKLLQSKKLDWHDLGGIIVFKGPGSFTGLRIGISTANALAYGLGVPIVAVGGKDWQKSGLSRLQTGDSDPIALPDYGAPVRVTKPRK